MTYGAPPVDDYNPAIPDYQAGTPPMDQTIRQAIASAILNLNVHIPGKITQVLGNQKVHVQPLLQSRYTNGKLITLPVIQNVPVAMPVGQDWSIKLPIAVGDTGYLLFSDRSLDSWLAGSGGITDPQDSRTHDISDATFVPGLVPFANQTTDSTTDMVLTNGQGILRIQKAGTFKLLNSSNELLDLMSQLADQCSQIENAGGPTTNAAIFAQLKTKIDTLKGS